MTETPARAAIRRRASTNFRKKKAESGESQVVVWLPEAIRERLDQVLGTDAGLVKEATLYPLLHRLERNGLLASHHEPGERGSPRKYYRLTPDGDAFLLRRIAEWRRVSALLHRTLLD